LERLISVTVGGGGQEAGNALGAPATQLHQEYLVHFNNNSSLLLMVVVAVGGRGLNGVSGGSGGGGWSKRLLLDRK
jgi:hypothetical protein